MTTKNSLRKLMLLVTMSLIIQIHLSLKPLMDNRQIYNINYYIHHTINNNYISKENRTIKEYTEVDAKLSTEPSIIVADEEEAYSEGEPLNLIESKSPGKPRFKISAKWNVKNGIGNIMFQYAALLGIAKANNMQIVIPKTLPIRKFFELSKDVELSNTNRPGKNWKQYRTGWICCFFTRQVFNLTQNNTEIRGYRQSWKYFQYATKDIRTNFKFHDPIEKVAENTIKNAIYENFQIPKEIPRKESNVVVVGIHVRRTSMVTTSSLSKGQVDTNTTYIRNAMKWFTEKYHKNKLLFIVCSDDMKWSLENLNFKDYDVFFARGYRDYEDMAILSKCDHMITTLGTFSWWSAWLTGGDVIYDATWPRVGSVLDRGVNKSNYFPPNWKAI